MFIIFKLLSILILFIYILFVNGPLAIKIKKKLAKTITSHKKMKFDEIAAQDKIRRDFLIYFKLQYYILLAELAVI